MPNPNPKLAADVILLLEQGKSAGEIMAALNVTRGQIAGIRHRAKIDVAQSVHTGNRRGDEKILLAITLRISGLSIGKIAERLNRPEQWVRSLTSNVLRDDLKESGEKPGVVQGAYW